MKVTLRVKKLDTPRKVAYMRLLKRIGSGCVPKEPLDGGDVWDVPFDTYYPSIIMDQEIGKEKTVIFHLVNVGKISINKQTMKIEKAPTLHEVRRSVHLRRSQIQQLVERDLIEAMGDPHVKVNFGVLKYAWIGLQPVYRITLGLLQEADYLSLETIEAHARVSYQDFIEMIVKLGYAEYRGRRLVPSNKLKELRRTRDDMETSLAMIGIVLSKYYDYLIRSLRIINFVPYLRLGASYYSDAVQFGRLISMTQERLKSNVKDYYKGAPSLSLRKRLGIDTMINELVDARVFRWVSNDSITGHPDIFERLVGVREEFPILDEPYAF